LDSVSGVTSTPAIFEKAIAAGAEYEEAIRASARTGLSDMAAYEAIAIEDIRAAADVLRPVHDATHGADGFVSLEVSPLLANDTEGTVAEGRRLWRAVNRPNLMIKVPGTPAGIPAFGRLIAEGISVNVTLLFARSAYEATANAYLDGLEAWMAAKGDPARVASVASFFVSRIDAAVDALLDRKLSEAAASDEKVLKALRGKAAIANARLAYAHYTNLIGGERWKKLAAAGARPQRLLWASTGTKNPAYSDVRYVEELIGPDTVNTMPPATLEAFRDHGQVRASLAGNPDGAAQVLKNLESCGISLDAVTDKLLAEGVTLFADAFDKLLAALAYRMKALAG
jgi:transaldolase/glucose-6-phosphate isomerase